MIEIRAVPVAKIIEAIFLSHEGLRILPDLVPNSGIIAIESLQRGMVICEFVVLRQRRIPTNLFGDLRVTAQEVVESRHVLVAVAVKPIVRIVCIATSSVVIIAVLIKPIVVPVVGIAIELVLPVHERVRILSYARVNARMTLQESLQV